MSITLLSNAWRRPVYVVQQMTPLLANEVLHSGLLGADLHQPLAHVHVEADITDLSHDPNIHGPVAHVDQTRRLWIPANLWEGSVVPTATLGTVVDTPCWQFPDAALNQIVSFLRPPLGSDQLTMAFRLYLATGVGAVGMGNMEMVFECTEYTDGDAITAAGGGAAQTVAIPGSGAGISLLTIVNVGPTVFGLGDYFAVAFTRRGDLPAFDTYTGEVYLIALDVSFMFES